MARQTTHAGSNPLHVSLVAIPDAVISTIAGIYDVLNAPVLASPVTPAPFHVEIVGLHSGPVRLASGIPIDVQQSIDTIKTTDLVIVPSVLLGQEGWLKGRYPEIVDWIKRMHKRGAVLCSACSGIFLLAESGLFDGQDATVHFGYAEAFSSLFPKTTIHPERVLVISGKHEEFVTSGASTTWHDLILYLTARYSGATTAQDVARTFALQWHQDGLAPFIVFEGKKDHGDGEITSVQQWLSRNFAIAHPIDEAVKRSRLAERTFKRRFTAATGLSPIAYVQRLRIEDAKRRLERTDEPVDEISWRVGYEDPAFFRRLFKRVTDMAPGAYRKRFRIPDFAQP